MLYFTNYPNDWFEKFDDDKFVISLNYIVSKIIIVSYPLGCEYELSEIVVKIYCCYNKWLKMK